MTREQLKERVRKLPMQPGVYMHKDKTGKVIYVGKAKLLKNRVSNYFQPPERLNAKTRQLVSHIDDFDIIVTDSEFEALVLENSMIKKYKPKYNILLKDDKGYPYVRLDTTLPNAFMIDGGLGHVHVCKEVLDSFGLSVPCFGMVKDDRHRTRALVAPDGREFGISATPALFALIGRMQEEVHRFAIEYNRKLGGKKVRGSTLDKIPGVGDKRRTDLLKHFGSIENIKQASEQELARILPRNAAQSVYEFFHQDS